MEYVTAGDGAKDLRADRDELRQAVGLETHESTSKNESEGQGTDLRSAS